MTPLWEPTKERIASTAMDRVRRDIAEAIEVPLADSRSLYEFSLEHPGDFWDVIWGELGVIGDRADGPAYVLPPAGKDMRDARFFPAASMNFAENLLRGGEKEGANDVAVVFRREDGHRRELTWQELSTQAYSFAAFLRSVGVEPGDRVAAFMPNVPETVIGMLGSALVGAVFTSTSPDFGTAGVIDRFGQVEPKVLIATDGYIYANKTHDRREIVCSVIAALPSLRAVVIHSEVGLADAELMEQIAEVAPTVSITDFQRLSRTVPDVLAGISAPLFPIDHPLYILYSSGTTGVPKCIVHRAGGLLIKHLVEHQLHCDIRPGDRVLYFTTCGWMMWNWLVSALASGATIVLYDGSPLHPHESIMWDLIDDESVTLFGTSAKFLDASLKAGLKPRESHQLSELRTICSTGSPLSHEGFEFVYRDVKADVHLASISGGTDLCGCFVMGDPTQPVYAGEIQGPSLGVAIDVWDPAGKSLKDRPGERGELVATQGFPSMPLAFWDDPGAVRYSAAYFERFPGIWAHGDFAAWTEHGGVIIYGRSDATLNAGGVRIGTAEIYRQVEQLPEVAEALAIGQQWDDDTRIVLFVRCSGSSRLDDELAGSIRATLRRNCSPRHVPARIIEVSDLPRTRSGKLAELAVADVVHGREVRNVEALANPQSLQLFVDVPELRS